MKKLKKITALLLAVVMVLGMSMTVFAENGDESDGYTVTINGNRTGHEYKAYQIFAGTVNDAGTILADITWGCNINSEEFVTYLSKEETGVFAGKVDGEVTDNIFADLTSATDIAKRLMDYTENDQMVARFAEAASGYLENEPAGVSTIKEGTTKYTIPGLKAGYYLIKDETSSSNEESDFYSNFILTIVGNAEVTVKGSAPSVNMTVNTMLSGTYTETIDVQMGDTYYYKLEGTLPSNFDTYDTYTYKFVSTLSEGIQFEELKEVYVLKQDGSTITIPNKMYGKPDILNGDNGKTTVTLTITDLKELSHTYALSDKIVVKYSACLNNKAKVGDENENSVHLEYSNNPYYKAADETDEETFGMTPEDTALVYTFGLTVNKIDASDSNNKLSGAKFVIYKRDTVTITDGEDESEKAIYHYVLFDGDGRAYGSIDSEQVNVSNDPAAPMEVWENTYKKYETSKEVNIGDAIFTSKEGTATISGLDGTVYRLLEIEAPDGYNLPQSRVLLSLEPKYEGENYTLSEFFYEVDAVTDKDNNKDSYSDGYKNGYINVTIKNSKGTTLPSTGGIGTTVFYIIGGVLVAAAVILLVAKKRMRAE